MLNLLGASKEDFKELMKQMNYKYIEEKEKFYFKYTPKKNSTKLSKAKTFNSPFSKLQKITIVS